MIGYPLDSHVTYDEDGIPVFDRAITSAPMRKLYKSLFSDGVLPNPSTNMQVSAGDGMNVLIQPGFAMCNGCLKLEEEQRTLAVQASDATYDRIDTVVLRLNDNDSERICDFYIIQGAPATSPVRPELTRNESVWEIGLADLFISKSSTVVSNQRITDTRYESERCGVISSISEFDTTTLYQQIQADLSSFQKEEQTEFITWFENIKDQLSEDAAGNLQKQIGDLEELKTETKENLVSAVNEVKSDLGGYSFYNNPTVIGLVEDGTFYTDVNGGYVLADSVLGEAFLSIDEYCALTAEGSYYSVGGADTVSPFKGGDNELKLPSFRLNCGSSTGANVPYSKLSLDVERYKKLTIEQAVAYNGSLSVNFCNKVGTILSNEIIVNINGSNPITKNSLTVDVSEYPIIELLLQGSSTHNGGSVIVSGIELK